MREEPSVSIRLVLADDHVLVRQGLRTLLEGAGFVVVGEATDGREAVRLVLAENPDVAVIDISMPQFNGLNAALELTRTCPRTRLIVLTQHDEPQYVAEALRCGAKGYVLKSQAARDLVRAIEGVCRGEVYLSPGVASAVAEAYVSRGNGDDGLSVRERQVLQLIAEGDSTKAIATRLGISAKTVESHRSKLMRKLDIHDTAGLVRYAIRRGVTQP
jgi:DNA-binding NarL/FixJ family response regulator